MPQRPPPQQPPARKNHERGGFQGVEFKHPSDALWLGPEKTLGQEAPTKYKPRFSPYFFGAEKIQNPDLVPNAGDMVDGAEARLLRTLVQHAASRTAMKGALAASFSTSDRPLIEFSTPDRAWLFDNLLGLGGAPPLPVELDDGGVVSQIRDFLSSRAGVQEGWFGEVGIEDRVFLSDEEKEVMRASLVDVVFLDEEEDSDDDEPDATEILDAVVESEVVDVDNEALGLPQGGPPDDNEPDFYADFAGYSDEGHRGEPAVENFVGYDLDAPDDFDDLSDDEDDESFEVYLKPAEVVAEDVWNKPLEHEELYRAPNGTLDVFFLPDEEELKGGTSQISSLMERQRAELTVQETLAFLLSQGAVRRRDALLERWKAAVESYEKAVNSSETAPAEDAGALHEEIEELKADCDRIGDKLERSIRAAKELDASCKRIGSRVLDFASFGGREFQTNQGEIERLDKKVEEFAKEIKEMDELEYLDKQFAKFQEEARLQSEVDKADPYSRPNPAGRAVNTEQHPFMRSESAQTRVGSGEAQEYTVINDDEDYIS